ncbi:hypothetical protein M378DRAFT_591316 [Amanita muscaria Koide BX008]|uniref:Uncharacterized protein n=1 Tax=Amanita muscaria (strain Koide BX008) TaxID=946122 RepID=A0A0C2WFZ7_AMAMK|nr:hypothetical protein M378DRAFT_591316 [Amanita muscaria Koide BX008]
MTFYVTSVPLHSPPPSMTQMPLRGKGQEDIKRRIHQSKVSGACHGGGCSSCMRECERPNENSFAVLS